MPNGWKFTRANGTDHRTGTINYRDNIGREMVHPCPDTRSKDACGEGYHLGKTLKGAGTYCAPGAVFRCSYSREDILGEDGYKVRVSKLTVLEEVPAWKGYGPRGKQVQAFIDSLSSIPWFEHVGEPYKQPIWAENMTQVDSWYAAFTAAEAVEVAYGAVKDAIWAVAEAVAGIDAVTAARAAAGIASRPAARAASRPVARAAAWDAARAAAEIMGGIKNGYFSRLMEVYRDGHYPCSWDGETLVVY